MEFEEERLCFKIAVSEGDQSALRNSFSVAVLSAARELSFPVKRPEKFGKGQYMTVAVFDGDYRTASAGMAPDWRFITDTIRQAQLTLDRAIEIFGSAGAGTAVNT